MNWNSHCGRTVRAGAAVTILLICAGSAASQVETRDWLLLQSGLWSDPLNWSGGDVPDTTLEVARLSPGSLRPLGLSGAAPVAMVDGVYEVLRLEGDGSVGVLIAEGAELSIFERDIVGVAGGGFTVTLGTGDATVAMPSVLTMGGGGGRGGEVVETGILMHGAVGAPSEIRGSLTLDPTSYLVGQGIIDRVTNTGTVVVTSQSVGGGELVVTDRLSNPGGRIIVEFTGQLVLDGSFLAPGDDTFNGGLISVLGGRVSGGKVRGGGDIEWIGDCTLSRTVLEGGDSVVDGTLTITPDNTYFSGNSFRLSEGAEIAFTDTVFLQGATAFSAPAREFLFEPGTITPRISAPDGESIIAMPGFRTKGPGIIDANFVNFGSIEIDSDDSFTPIFETLEIRGEFVQTSSGSLKIAIDPVLGGPVVDTLVIAGGDADLDGSLEIAVRVILGGDPFDQIAIANRQFTLLRIDDPSETHTVTGEFAGIDVQLLDERVSPIPEMRYLPDRVDARFYCRADVNRDGAVTPADFSAWIGAYQKGSPLADMTGNGLLTPADFSKWVELYNRGCP